MRERARYMRKRLASLQTVLKDLEDKNLINSSDSDLLSRLGVTSRELVKRQIIKSKKGGITIKKKYSPELRSFALTLNFYSAKAYQYVRKTFQTCLPSVKTLSKWYQTVDGKPGFTKEALIALKNRTAQFEGQLIGTLVFDEMKIKSKVEYVPSTQRTFGYVEFGGQIQADCSKECTEALVLLVVGLNSRFKVPIGYFLTDGTSAEQKKNLVLQAIDLCYQSNLLIKAVTFDGCPTNIRMAKLLGCVFSEDNFRTWFNHPTIDNHVYVFLDPVHMLKLVRNSFEFYQQFKNSDGKVIKWEYIKLLHQLQEREQFHLANKLRLSHIEFKQNVMKVKLAAQLFSRSVATALQFCHCELKLPEFQDVAATVDMLLLINDLFDILDSRVHGYGFKRALNKDNAPAVFERLQECKKYILNLSTVIKNKDTKLIKTNRYTGFIGLSIVYWIRCGNL
ncbi:unnamed protein product [Colias eurytheme]|nr:unnamed protein product [Colias eurytheme]